MTEQTKMDRIREFKDIAQQSPTRAALYFGQTFITPESSPEIQKTEYLQAVSHILRSYNGTTYQTPRPLDDMLEQIPHNDTREILKSFALALRF